MFLVLDTRAALSFSGSYNCENERDYFLISVLHLPSCIVRVDLEKYQLQSGREDICDLLKKVKALFSHFYKLKFHPIDSYF